jgi:hypothetical protein
MRKIKRVKPSAAIIVAVVALVAALGGGAVAGVTISKLNNKEKKQVKRLAKKLDKKIELLPGPQGERGEQGPPGPSTGPAGGDLSGDYPDPTIADDAVNGAKVLNDSIGGADVNESSLGLVPNASRLDGMDSSDFAPANAVHSAAATLNDNPGDAFQTLQTLVSSTAGGFSLRGECIDDLNGGDDFATVRLFGPNGYSVTVTDTNGGGANVVSHNSATGGRTLSTISDPSEGNLIEGAWFIAVAPPGAGDVTLAGHVSAELNNDGDDCTFGVNVVGG